jgi:hypothetical protein
MSQRIQIVLPDPARSAQRQVVERRIADRDAVRARPRASRTRRRRPRPPRRAGLPEPSRRLLPTPTPTRRRHHQGMEARCATARVGSEVATHTSPTVTRFSAEQLSRTSAIQRVDTVNDARLCEPLSQSTGEKQVLGGTGAATLAQHPLHAAITRTTIGQCLHSFDQVEQGGVGCNERVDERSVEPSSRTTSRLYTPGVACPVAGLKDQSSTRRTNRARSLCLL